MDPNKTHKIIAPAGCGKTTRLLSILNDLLGRGVAPDRIVFTTFTKSGAYEARDRACEKFNLTPSQLPLFRTLHSLCYRFIGKSKLLTNKDWFEIGRRAGVSLSPQPQIMIDGPTWVHKSQTGDYMLACLAFARDSGKSLRETYLEFPERQLFRYERLENFAKEIRDYKELFDKVDFTDMLERFVETRPRLSIDHVIVDEAQDLTPLQWRVVDYLAELADRTWLAGDDDQCHRTETLIDTAEGKTSIEQLKDGDYVSCWNRRGAEIIKEGRPIKVSSRPYEGDLLWITTETNRTNCTPNHKWTVRWSVDSKGRDHNVVYLMRRGARWRVGWCQLRRADGIFHLGDRARKAKADEAWVIKSGLTKPQASALASLVAAKYGISTILFNPTTHGRSYYSREVIDFVFESLGDNSDIAAQCLADFKRNIKYPFWSRDRINRHGTCYLEVRASNLLPESMLVGKAEPDRTVSWQPFVITREHYEGLVYSLEVEEHPNYISDGLVTHNCIYEYAGANASILVDLKARTEIQPRSYRVPAAVQKVSQGIVAQIRHRIAKEIIPRPGDPGRVHLGVDYESIDMSEGNWMILVRNRYVYEHLEPYLLKHHWLYDCDRPTAFVPGTMNRVFDWIRFLEDEEQQAGKLLESVKLMRPGTHYKPGLQKHLKNVPSDALIDIAEAKEMGLKRLDPWDEQLNKLSQYEKRWAKGFLDNKETVPRIILSTIHQAKGKECDNVVVVPDMSQQTHISYNKEPDKEHRIFYVAVTRARDELFWVKPRTNKFYRL